MSDDTATSIRKWGDQLFKWIATALVALCVKFASEIKGEVDTLRGDVSAIKVEVARIHWNNEKITHFERVAEKMDERLRELERSN